ncbi:hypothetical protein FQA39_LY05481 [Lamprigera yunnana]|nr:hypothetical protein FQA39_LY05481 [Lamprigera yunnana]
MAPTYKLTYFQTKGVAEPIRFLLSYGEIDFEDCRIDRKDWPELKEQTLFGQLPILEIDGKRVNQSIAICKYLARQVNLNGGDDWEDLQIDSIVHTIDDFKGRILMYHLENDEEVKEKRKDVLYKETIPYYMGRFEDIVLANSGHFVAEKLTWADLYFVGVLDLLNSMAKKELIEDYPNLKQLQYRVENLPAIKNWIKKQPTTVL